MYRIKEQEGTMPGIVQPPLYYPSPCPHFPNRDLRRGENQGLGQDLCHLAGEPGVTHSVLLVYVLPSAPHTPFIYICHLPTRTCQSIFVKIRDAIEKILLSKGTVLLPHVAVIDVLLGAKCCPLLFLSANLQICASVSGICAVFPYHPDLSGQNDPFFRLWVLLLGYKLL